MGKKAIAETWTAWKQPVGKPLVFILRGQPQKPDNLDGIQDRVLPSLPGPWTAQPIGLSQALPAAFHVHFHRS